MVLSCRSGMDLKGNALVLPLDATVHEVNDLSPDYIQAMAGLDARLPESPFVMYRPSMSVSSETADTWASFRQPHFNRSWHRFRSHQHKPYQTELKPEQPTVISDGCILYFAHSACEEWQMYG